MSTDCRSNLQISRPWAQQGYRRATIKPGHFIALLCSTVTILLQASAAAQEPLLRFLHVPPERSFASRWLIDVAQDQQGFIWFASLNGGFARYDGYEFRVYRHDPYDPNSLPSNTVHALYVDPSGDMLWVGMAQGLVSLDLHTEELTVYRHDPGDEQSLSKGGVFRVLRDRSGDLWVATESGVSRMRSGTTGFTHPAMSDPRDPPGRRFVKWTMELYEDHGGTLWVGTFGGGLLRYDARTESFQRFLNDPADTASLPDSNNSVRALFEDRRGQLWVGTDQSLAILSDRASGHFEKQADAAVRAIAEDLSGNLWVATRDNLLLRQPGSSGFFTLRHESANPGGIGPGLVNRLLVDASGRLWAPGDQISYLPPNAMAFTLFRNPQMELDSSDLMVDSKGRAWVGAKNGLFELDTVTGQWTHHLPFPEATDAQANWVYGFGSYEDADGGLWVTTSTALSKFEPGSATFESRALPAAANDMLVSSQGELWLAVPYRGLQRFDFKSGEAEIFKHDANLANTISHDYGYLVLEDQDGAIWYGSHDGLDRFDPASGTAQRYFSGSADPRSLSNASIHAGIIDTRGQLWFGTEFGLNRFDPQSDDFTRYLDGVDPGRNAITTIVEAPDGSFWLGTGAGLARFNPDTGVFTSLTSADGLPPGFVPDVNLGPDGMVYSLAPAGVVRVDPAYLVEDQPPERLAWTDLMLLHAEDGASNPGVPDGGLELGHQDKLVSIGFAALGIAEPENASYQYRLSGLHDGWVTADASNRKATFSELQQGSYLLELRAAGRNGVWSQSAISLPIRVLPPPWRTWWAYALYCVTAVALLSAFVTWRTRSHRRREAMLEAAVRERTTRLEASEMLVRTQSRELQELLDLKERLFANISHEFRTPLTLMLGPIETARQATENQVIARQLEMARRNGRRVLRLVDQLLELSRLSSETPPQHAPQPIGPVATNVIEAFGSLAQQHGLSLSLLADDTLWTDMPADVLERLLMNLLSNAVKFTPEGGVIRVEITANPDAEHLSIQVSDTGIGIPADRQQGIFDRFSRVDTQAEGKPGSGIGLALVKELVDVYGGQIQVDSSPGSGTVFTITLPRFFPPEGLRVHHQAPRSEALQLEIDALEQASAEEALTQEQSDRFSVLVIEDNRDMRAYLGQLLGMEYQVSTVHSGEQGLEFADREIPDLVICDLSLPGIDGFAVARELRRNVTTSHIPIVMLTARNDDESRLQGLREHVDDYLIKPFNNEELLLRVANLLAIRDILRARFGGSMIAGSAPRDTLKETERRFLNKLEGVLESYYAHPDFSITDMASKMAMSERQLQRKLKAITDQSPALYLRLFRLRRSQILLAENQRVSDVAFAVGFSSPAYFASCFRAQFNCTPTEFQSHPSQMNS